MPLRVLRNWKLCSPVYRSAPLRRTLPTLLLPPLGLPARLALQGLLGPLDLRDLPEAPARRVFPAAAVILALLGLLAPRDPRVRLALRAM